MPAWLDQRVLLHTCPRFFVGTLVAIGISLFAIRGNTVAEDTLLNFAGVLALFVALVPTERAPTACQPVLDASNRDVNIANNAGRYSSRWQLRLSCSAFSPSWGSVQTNPP